MGRQPRAEGQGVDTCVVGINQRVGAYVEGLYAAIECSERGNDIFRATDFEGHRHFETKLAQGCRACASPIMRGGITRHFR